MTRGCAANRWNGFTESRANRMTVCSSGLATSVMPVDWASARRAVALLIEGCLEV